MSVTISDQNADGILSQSEVDAQIGTGSDIIIGSNVTVIGAYALNSKQQITSLTIPSSVVYIDQYAFTYSYYIKSINIPDSVTDIGIQAFRFVQLATSLTIGSGLTSIAGNVFDRLFSLQSITIPDTVRYLGPYAFFQNNQATSLTIGSGVTHIEYSAFGKSTNIRSIIIPNSVMYIGNDCFEQIFSATSLTLGSGVTSISNWCFYRCSAIPSITIPNSVKYIGNGAFQSNVNATSITIGTSVTYIGNGAFTGCNALTSVTMLSSLSNYSNSTYFSSNSTITYTYVAEPVTLTPNGSNILTSGIVNAGITDTDTDVIISDGTTTIEASAFAGVTDKIISIIIPTSVVSIGASAFQNCSLVTNTISDTLTLTEIGAGAFDGCPITISSINLSGSTQTSLGNNTFNGSNLENISLPKTITAIGSNCFNTIAQMESITFHEDMVGLLDANIPSQIKATDIYLNPSILRANAAATGKIWATSNYHMSLSTRIRFGPTGVILPDGSKVPTTIAGTMIRSSTLVGGTTTYAVMPLKQSFPETEYGYSGIVDVSGGDNITLYPGFNMLCTKVGTDDPNNNSSASITIPGDATTSTGFSVYTDNTSGSTNANASLTTTYPNILLFYNDTLVRTMPGSA